MLDFIYFPVSAILWFWHTVFGFVLGGPASGAAWVLAIVFLVFTIRALLYRPFVKQVRMQELMQRLQPEIKELQRKHGKDRQRLATEFQALQREHGFNPLLTFLPMLAQIPVFIGLFHVLRSFHAGTSNYVFGTGAVQSFLDAKLFGAPLSATLTTSPATAAIAIVLIVVTAIATHFTARASIARQSAASITPQTALQNNLALWIFPAGALAFGPFLPITILIYWVSGNAWTYAQQYVVYRA